MTTKVPFAFRCGVLSAIVLVISGTIFSKLVALQIVDAAGHGNIAAYELISRERIPAQRGIVMDRNEEILTNNIQRAEVVADRNHLRELTAVVDGLAYNQCIHDDEWIQAEDKVKKRKIFRKHRAKLMDNATLKLTQEEKAELRSKIDPKDARANRMLEYDPQVCEYYYSLHDKLVADILYPFLSHIEITVDAPEKEASPAPGARSERKTAAPAPAKVKRYMTREDIVNLIAQPDVTEHNKKAEEEGSPTRSYRMEIILAKGLTLDVAEKIKEALKAANVRGVMVQSELRRSYVMPQMLCHVLGYVNHENKGMCGVESYFNSYLAGVDGIREYRHDSRGQVLPNEDDRYMAPKHGLNLRLTIDMRLQTILEQELDKGMAHFRAKRGCMIAVEPKTGDILAMVSRPAFDLNSKEIILPDGAHPRGQVKDAKGAPVTGDFNFACQARYEPGSTFKVVAVTTAVDSNIMTIDTPVDCSPFIVSGGGAIKDSGGVNYGTLTVGQVLMKSSNPGAAHIAMACKWPRYKEYIERFGLTKATGLELPSGGACLMADGSKLINFSRIAYGYSVSVSPLHMAMVYATIANDGKRMKPRLIDKIIAADGSIYDECPPQVIETVMKPSTAKAIKGALFSVTQKVTPRGQGTATRAAIPGFRIGGKTGTAKKVTGRGGYYDNLYTVSFAGLLPVDDPKVVIMTVIDEPHPTDCNVGGGTVAAPIFRAAAERIIDVLNIEPSDPAAYAAYKAEKNKEQAATKK